MVSAYKGKTKIYEHNTNMSAYSYINWLKGKTINFMGDSITYGYIPNDGGQMEKPYPQQVGEILECTANNYGISGSTLSTTSNGMVSRVAKMDINADLNVLFGGTNDVAHNVTLGDISSTSNTTIYGALNNIADVFVTNFSCPAIFCTPLKRDESVDLIKLRQAIIDVANKYNFGIIDLYNDAPLFNPNITSIDTTYCGDKLHPNQKYITEIFSPFMARQILNKI